MKYTVQMFYDDVKILYESVNSLPFRATTLPEELKEFGSLVEKVYDQKFITYKKVDAIKFPETNNVGVCFSGGKDSASLAVHLRNKGMNVKLFHTVNMNRAYTDEKPISKGFAERYGFDYTQLALPLQVRKGTFIENPIKNNLLITQVLANEVKFGKVSHVGLGCATGNDSMLSSFGFSDSNQNLSSFGRGVEQLFGVKILVNEIESEGLAYKTLIVDGYDFKYITSCMMPNRYRKQHRERNIAKGVDIRPDGCGHCYKCAMDYFYLEFFKILPFSDINYRHYADVLKRHWDRVFSEKPESIRAFIKMFLSDKYMDVNNVLKRYDKIGIDIDSKF